MRYFSMFSGMGGFECGINKAIQNQQRLQQLDISQQGVSTNTSGGGQSEQKDEHSSGHKKSVCVGYSEIDKYASAVYRHKFGTEVRNYGDATRINTEEIADIDFLVGGFPCQAFSIAGQRRGFDDTRGTLFFEIARVLKSKQPKMFLLENVKGLLNHDEGNTFTTILRTIDELGYNAEWQVLNSKHFGVPQNRERVFIVGHLRGAGTKQIFPIGLSNQETNLKHGIISNSAKREVGFKNVSPCLLAGDYKQPKSVITKVHSLQPRSGDPSKGGTGHLTKSDGTSYCLDTGNSQAVEVYHGCEDVVIDQQGDVWQKELGYEGELTQWVRRKDTHIRRLTPTECERLQGFDDQWTKFGEFDGEVKEISDTQRYKMCGNAVTVNVIAAIISKILEVNKL